MRIRFLIICSFCLLGTSYGQLCVGTQGELEWHAWNNLYEGEFSDLTAMPDYPNSPEVVKKIFRLQSPSNYNNYFGSRTRGFLHVETNTTVQFNVTGNKEVQLYLSTDDNPSNKLLIAYSPDEVGSSEHNQYPEQTSGNIYLVAGQNYYFEVISIDNWGSDHWAVWWKTDLVDPLNWNVITASFLSGVSCEDSPCQPAGTTCDDGDPNTENDIEDGYCNCFGSPITTDTCVGERGKLTGYRYDNIPGSALNDLYEDPNFPGMPVSSEAYEYFSKPASSDYDQQGFTIQSYLTVPVTGLYKFNITGDDNTILFLSSDDNPENKQAHMALVTSYSGMTEHDKYIYQSTAFLHLEKGQYYYIEVNLKQSSWVAHFSVFWQTPFTEPGQWKRIPSHYFHDYNCEVACIQAGTPCDDGNPFTNNDIYNNNCECEGIPCSGPDCDSPLANYVPFDKCGLTDQLDNTQESNWISCEKTTSPNPSRGDNHWIMYDLGKRHELHQSQIWNYNENGNTLNGMGAVAIDYSLDGSTWLEFGTYNWPLANGSSSYGGFAGPNFNGLYARYILISSLESAPGCKGLGKVAFSAVSCPVAGTACDDNDEYTFNDQYDNSCECKGSLMDENDCGEQNVVLGDSTLFTHKYSAIESVSSVSSVAPENKVAFVGGQSVILEPGFETIGQTLFLASIDPCNSLALRNEYKSRYEAYLEKQAQLKKAKIDVLSIQQIDGDKIQISYFLEKPGQAKLEIYNRLGLKMYTLADHEFRNQGVYHKNIRTKRFKSGSYHLRLTSSDVLIDKELQIVK